MQVDIEKNTAASFAAGLRALVDFLDAHPEAHDQWERVQLDHYVTDKDAMRAKARELTGRWMKEATDHSFALTRTFDEAGAVRVRISGNRTAICTPVIVGVETVEVTDPAYEAPPAPKVKIERDVVEWQCPESLLSV